MIDSKVVEPSCDHCRRLLCADLDSQVLTWADGCVPQLSDACPDCRVLTRAVGGLP